MRERLLRRPPWCRDLAITALCTTVLGACAARGHPGQSAPSSSADEIVITQEQIQGLDARTAWEVVKRKVPNLSYQESSSGRPTRVWRHGRGSIVLNENPLLFVDGVRVSDIGALEDIPSSQVDTIRILTGLAATTAYGTNAASGVVLVQTKRGG